MEVMDSDGIKKVSQEELSGDLIFRLNPFTVSGDTKDEPMWSFESQSSMDWFFSEE
ncbi:MAG TPA: hypothetical protein VN328_13155 [Thermodesulfovibrionales bacterium]|nr:hypothetical protein [Thermodesulfovibrionales bacterium]